MLFNSFIFIFFLIIVFPIFFTLSKKYRNPFLLVASYIFYGYWDWRFCFLLLLSTVIDFTVSLEMYNSTNKIKRRNLLILSVVANLGILFFFKYFNFFIDSFQTISQQFGGKLDYLHLNIILPVGISFYTFQTLSYTIDIYKSKLKPTRSFIDFALFVSFFPQLVAGPIERAANLLPQLQKKPIPSKQQIHDGIILIITGLFKKVIIGDSSGKFVDHIFGQPEIYKSPELLMGLILFSVQIYADFSGYSSIARGTAKLFGIELVKNFEQPYLSTNITEFWRRWHISLSSCLKDYLYISLGGNRQGKIRTYANLLITMLLGGLWHGANWTFVVWGGLHGIYLAIHKLMLKNRSITNRYSYKGIKSLISYILKVIVTYCLVLVTWLFFRANSISSAFYIIKKFVFWENGEFLFRNITISLSYLIFVLLFDIFEYYTRSHVYFKRLPTSMNLGFQLSMFVITLAYMFQTTPVPFVYFQF